MEALLYWGVRQAKDVHVLILEPVDVTLYGKRVFANVIKVKDLELDRSSWIFGVGSILLHDSLKAEKIFQLGQTDVIWEGFDPLWWLLRWKNWAMSQGMYHPPETGKDKEMDYSSLEPPERNAVLPTPWF